MLVFAIGVQGSAALTTVTASSELYARGLGAVCALTGVTFVLRGWPLLDRGLGPF